MMSVIAIFRQLQLAGRTALAEYLTTLAVGEYPRS